MSKNKSTFPTAERTESDSRADVDSETDLKVRNKTDMPQDVMVQAVNYHWEPGETMSIPARVFNHDEFLPSKKYFINEKGK